ncbi:7 transmembrane receptor (Secretin) [Branchiostoma belcheri]|nr:7 transmembrane receptor (Secretin) [Branchiostoma belcheri]
MKLYSSTENNGYTFEGYTEIQGAHYKVFTQALTYTEAKQVCASEGGHLAHIKTQETHDLLVNMIQTQTAGTVDSSSQDYWIGFTYVNGMSIGISLTHIYAHIPGNPWEDPEDLSARMADETWTWSDGTPLTFTNWAPSEPGKNGLRPCGQLWAEVGLLWDDDHCDYQKYFICQKQIAVVCCETVPTSDHEKNCNTSRAFQCCPVTRIVLVNMPKVGKDVCCHAGRWMADNYDERRQERL